MKNDPTIILNRYEIGSLIGRGGMADVFEGRDLQTGDRVAIKRLRGDLVHNQPEAIERFRRESEVLSKLNHPNIVKLLGAGEADGKYYLVMEYVDGGTLADLLKQQPQLPLEQALGIALELADALARTHHLKIIHRDIKPTNILLTQDKTPRLTDFGLAFILDTPRLTQPGIAIGTWLYLSPEVCGGAPPDERADIWSFGITVYEMLSGRLPYYGDSPASIVRQIAESPIPRMTQFRHDIPVALDKLIQRMLMRDVILRASSFRQIGAEIQDILQNPRAMEPVSDPVSVPIEVQWTDESAIPSRDSSPYLLTKVSIPPQRARAVERPRLVHLLESGLTQGRRLTLVSAPAGFGKTTLVVDWLTSSARPVAWLSLDEYDNDIAHFLQYLIAALERVDPNIGQTSRHLLSLPRIPPLVTLLTPLINDLSGVPSFVLVLDDYQVITAEQIHEAVRIVVERLPPSMHLVITSREDPPLPLARLRVRNWVTEIRERELRFSQNETAAFFSQTMGLNLTSELSERLLKRAEGWIAALQLAALALQESGGHGESVVTDFTGDERYVMDYLTSEVFERQTEHVQAFLRQTSILDQLCAPLCDAVRQANDSAAMLEQLEASNLFLLPLDQRRKWYRYHRLFVEALHTTLDRDETEEAALHQRAADWYAGKSAIAEAIRHALAAARLNHDYVQAIELIRTHVQRFMDEGQLTTILRWLDTLPDNQVRAHPELLIDRAWILVVLGELARAEHEVARAEAGFEALNSLNRGKLRLTQGFLALARGDLALTIQLAEQSSQLLGQAGSENWRLIALWALAEAQERSAPIAESIASLRKAVALGGSTANSMFKSVIALSLATALNTRGQRREAVSVCQSMLNGLPDTDERPSPATAVLLARLAELDYETNDLAGAQAHLERAQALSKQLGLEIITVVGEAIAAKILMAKDDYDQALLHLRAAHSASQVSLADTTWIHALEGALYLKRGDIHAAQKWADEIGLRTDQTLHYLHMEQDIVYGRLLLVEDRLKEMQHWLERLDAFASERGYKRWTISLRALRAAAAARSDDSQSARRLLTDAVRIAAPEGYVRALLDEPEVLELLPVVRHEAPGFIDAVLKAAQRQRKDA